MLKKIDHIGIAVDNIDGMEKFFTEVLGIELECIEEIPNRKIKVAFYPIGDTDLELLEETCEGSSISYYLNSLGNGVQHLAFEVDDIDKAVEYIRSKGIEFIEKEPEKGARSRRIIFIKPEYTAGVRIELCQCE